MSLEPQDAKVEQDSSVFYSYAEDEAQSSAPTRIDSEFSYFGKKLLPAQTHLTIGDDDYDMNHRNRGKVIIFNHETYDPKFNEKYDPTNRQGPPGPREGTKVDEMRLEETFTGLGFKVRVLNDPTIKNVRDKIESERKNLFHYSSDCLVIIVLTHGKDGGKLCASDGFYAVSDLWSPFMAEKCPALATKPKIFIIQACRGGLPSTAVPVNRATKLSTDGARIPDETETFTIPNEADILLAYSTYEGRVAYRHPEQGTWYIDELCNELAQSAKTDDLLTMLTRVNRRVALAKEHYSSKQMPSIQSTLTRKIYFGERSDSKRSDQISSGPSLQEINMKLDRLVEMMKVSQSTSSEVSQRIPRKINSSAPVSLRNVSIQWKTLRERPAAGLATLDNLPAHDVVFRHAKTLKMCLERHDLKSDVQENGRMILTLLSFWNVIDPDTRKYAYMNTVSFLRFHASDWSIVDIVDIPNARPLRPAKSASTLPRSRVITTRPRKNSTASLENNVVQSSKPPFKF